MVDVSSPAMKIRSLLPIACMALLSCGTMRPHETGFLIRTVVVNGTTYPYSVYVPLGFDESKSWPVILSLHGAGERGMDGLRSTQIGVAAAIRANPGRVPAVVVFPQAPEETRWHWSSSHWELATMPPNQAMERTADRCALHF